MTVIDQLDLFEFDEMGGAAPAAPPKKKKRCGPADYRRSMQGVPVPNGQPFVIVPEVSPILREVAALAAAEQSEDFAQGTRTKEGAVEGVGIIAARAALILGQTEAAVTRRLYAIVHNKQLFAKATFVEACLMTMDLEREYEGRYGEWPSCRADALEKVSIEAEYKGQKLSPDKLLSKANQLYEKGVRKALKHAPEVTP